jgi:hypothetical protein
MSFEDTSSSVNSPSITSTNPEKDVSLEDLIKEPESPEEAMLMTDEFLQLTITILDEVENAAKKLMLTTTVGLSELRMPAETPPEHIEEFKDLVSKVITHNISVCRTLGVTKILVKHLKDSLSSGLEDKKWLITLIIGLYGASLSQAATQSVPDSCYKANDLDNAGFKFEDYEKMEPSEACRKKNSRVFYVEFNKYEFQKQFNVDPATAQNGLAEYYNFASKNLNTAVETRDTVMMEALLKPAIDALNREFKQLQNNLTNFIQEYLTIGRKEVEYEYSINEGPTKFSGKMSENVEKRDTLSSRAAQEYALKKSIKSAKESGQQIVPAELASSHGRLPTVNEALRILSNQGYESTTSIYMKGMKNSIQCQVTLLSCMVEHGIMKCQILIEGGMMDYDNIFRLINNFSDKLLKHSIPGFTTLQDTPTEAFGVLAEYAGTEKGQISLISQLTVTNYEDRLRNLGSSTIQMSSLLDELMTSIQHGSLLTNPNIIQVFQDDILSKINAKFLLKCFNGEIYFPSLMRAMTHGKALVNFIRETSNPTVKGQLVTYFESLKGSKYQDKLTAIFEASADLFLDEGLYFIQHTKTSTHTLISSGFNTVDNTALTWDKMRGRFLVQTEKSADYGFYVFILFILGMVSIAVVWPVKKGIKGAGDIITTGLKTSIDVVADTYAHGKIRFGSSGNPDNSNALIASRGGVNETDIKDYLNGTNGKTQTTIFYRSPSISSTHANNAVSLRIGGPKSQYKDEIIYGPTNNPKPLDFEVFLGGTKTRRHKKRIGAASKHHKKRQRGTKKPSKKRRATRKKRR